MKQRRLLVIVNNFHPDRGGGASVFTDMCYALAERGYEIVVRCAYPYYPEWYDKSGRNGWRIEREQLQRVAVERHGLYIPRNPGSLVQRLRYEGSFFLSLMRSFYRGGRFDAIMVYCPLAGSVAFACLLRVCRRIPVWLNVQDLPADAAAASGISQGSLVNRLFGGIQGFLFNRADMWSSISPVMIARLREIRKGRQPILYIPNWLNASLAADIDACGSKVEREPGPRLRLLYAGNIGAKQGLLAFVEELRKLDTPFDFRIHGSGAEAATVRAAVEAMADERISFGDFLQEREFAAALHWTDFFVITEKSESGASFIPSKLIPGLASGSAILAVCGAASPLGQEMLEGQPGPRLDWEELSGLGDLLAKVRQRPERLYCWQRQALARAELYRQEQVVSRIDQSLQVLMDTERPLAERISVIGDAAGETSGGCF